MRRIARLDGQIPEFAARAHGDNTVLAVGCAGERNIRDENALKCELCMDRYPMDTIEHIAEDFNCPVQQVLDACDALRIK